MSRLLELQKFANDYTDRWWFRLSNLYVLGGPKPAVEISKRLKTCAGKMSVTERKMILCFDLLDLYPDEFAKDIIPHELAHQMAYDVYGIGKNLNVKRIPWHGAEWCAIMGALGLDPGRCHDMVNTRHKKR